MSPALIKKVSKALRSKGGAASEYQNVCFELEALKGILEHLATLQPNARNVNHVNNIRATALACQIPLQTFLQKIGRFEASLGTFATPKSLSGAVRKGQWALFMTEEISRLRNEVCTKLMIINLALTIHYSESRSSIEAPSQGMRRDSGICLPGPEEDAQCSVDTKMEAPNRGIRQDSGVCLPELEEDAQSSLHTTNTVPGLRLIPDMGKQLPGLAKEPIAEYLALNKPSLPASEYARALITTVGTKHSSILSLEQVVERMLEVVTALRVGLRNLIIKVSNINLQIYNFVLNLQPNIAPSPLLQESDSILFEDALGRIKRLPYQFFKDWPMLVTFLQVEFQGLPGENLVNEGQYYIMDARANGHPITGSEWKRCVFPGAHVIMSMIVTRFLRGRGLCSRPNCVRRNQFEDLSTSMFQCSDCGTKYFPHPYSSFGFFPDQGDRVRDFEEWENFVGWVALKRVDQNPSKSGVGAAMEVMEEIQVFRRLHTPVEDGDWQPTAYPAETERSSRLARQDLTCRICGVTMPDYHTLILHQRTGHASPEERYRCPYQHHGNPKCRLKVFMRIYNLHRHLRHIHGIYKASEACMSMKERKELQKDLDRGRELARMVEATKASNWSADVGKLKEERVDMSFADIGTSRGSVFYDV